MGADVNPTRTCTVEGCERPFLAKGCCGRHYKIFRVHGDPTWTAPLMPTVCSVDQCEKTVKARGLCQKHYTRWLVRGDPNVVVKPGKPAGPDHHLYRGADITYGSAHSRVRLLHGSAKQYSCVECGLRAFDWAYDHEDPDARVDPVLRMVFSADPMHYRPLCRVCHQADDKAHRAQTQEVIAG